MRLWFLLVFIFIILSINGQIITVTGHVRDLESKEPLSFSNIVVKGTTTGVSADLNGSYAISLDFSNKENITLMASYVGYMSKEIVIAKGVEKFNFYLETVGIFAKEIVVSASRVGESLMSAPISIQKLNAQAIRNSSSGDFYQSLGNLSGIDVVTSSMGFKTINTRGFNTTSPVRSVQFIDGMDNQAPGLNFPIGNLVGASEMDLKNIEIISGAASALYGANAFQGVINMTTKDPFDYSGLSAQVKGGSNNLVNTQFRFAETLGKDKRFGYKIVAEYMSAKDWIADDNEINRYGDLEVDVNLTEIVTQLQYDETLSTEDQDDYKSLNTYMWFYPLAQPGTITLNAPGYMESDLSDNSVESIKASMGLYYKFSDSLKLSYLPKWGKGTAVYQGSNRYSINDITAFQHKLELTGHNFFLKGYSTYENAGNSYDIVFTGINLSKLAAADYTAEYLGEYFNALSDLTNEFSGSPNGWAVDSAHNQALAMASQQWYQKGTAKFDSAYSAIVSNPDLKEGSKFLDKSALHHIEGQYNINTKAFDMIMGASYRLYEPNSYGSIFSDTILDRGDTLADGSLDLNADFAEISVYEYGAFSQFSKRLCNDKLKITASARMDKSKNYDWQFSPRFSAVYTIKDHNFRFSLQQAFRSPTLQNQYLLLDIGPIILSGNLNGASNMYTFASVVDFMDTYNNSFDVDESILETLNIDPIKPEQLSSFELGYRGILDQGFYVDMGIYYNIYSNFIGNIRGYEILGDAVAGEETGVDALLTHTDEQPNYELYQYPVNASEEVISYGGSVGLVYYFNKHYSAKTNFTYSEIDTSALTDAIIPGYNTPRHKLNFGITAKDIFDGWGMSLNYKWSQGFLWESPFGDGDVPAFAMLDVQVRYKYKEWNSMFKLGASNLLNNKHIEAYGGPSVGRLMYLSWTYDFIH